MKKIESIISGLTRYIGVIIIIFSVLAFIVPSGFAWATNYTSWFLGAAMFGMGLTIKVEDFKAVLTRPKEIIIGCIAQYTIMPLSAWALSMLLKLPPDLAVGVILVGCCPGGTASNVITYIAGGDVSLSVGMTIVSTLLAPIMTPFLTYLLAGAWVDVSLAAMIISVTKVILVPVLLGIVIHRILGRAMEKISSVVPLISVVAIVMIIAGIVANNVEKILTCGLLVLGVVMLHNLLGLLLGLGASKVFKVEYDKATAIAIEVAMQNSGLAVSLAAANFASNPLATLPGAIFSVWHNISGSIFASLRRAGARKQEDAQHLAANAASGK
ncbi:MAG: bile acid:sodium symporter family protein [Eubacteriales bacterium]|nr:bile acid:sodium symporter family protein [Eubacteriales bacterium]